jgi:hypothetical protein
MLEVENVPNGIMYIMQICNAIYSPQCVIYKHNTIETSLGLVVSKTRNNTKPQSVLLTKKSPLSDRNLLGPESCEPPTGIF